MPSTKFHIKEAHVFHLSNGAEALRREREMLLKAPERIKEIDTQLPVLEAEIADARGHLKGELFDLARKGEYHRTAALPDADHPVPPALPPEA